MSSLSVRKPRPTNEREHFLQLKQSLCHCRSSKEMYLVPPSPVWKAKSFCYKKRIAGQSSGHADWHGDLTYSSKKMSLWQICVAVLILPPLLCSDSYFHPQILLLLSAKFMSKAVNSSDNGRNEFPRDGPATHSRRKAKYLPLNRMLVVFYRMFYGAWIC